MSGMNLAIIVGRLGQEPEIRYTAAGDPVANLSVATSKKYKGNEETEWHRVVCFGKLPGGVREWVPKGDLCGFRGEIRTRKWQDAQGNDKYSTEIIAHNMDMLGSANRDSGAKTSAQSPQSPNRPMEDSDGPAKTEPVDDGFDDIPF